MEINYEEKNTNINFSWNNYYSLGIFWLPILYAQQY